MKQFFADTFYFIALANPQDAFHERAVRHSRELRVSMVTTAWVLAEVADAFASTHLREVVPAFLDELRSDPNCAIIEPTITQFDLGMKLYEKRNDKQWSLTDCISFHIMKEMDIQSALTGDHHFAQAGFEALFLKADG